MKATFSMSSLGVGGGVIDRKEDEDEDDPLKKLRKESDSLRKTCFNNISAVYAKMGEWDKSLEKSQKVLEMDDKNQKALYRCGVAYRNLREYEKAKESLLAAQKLGDSPSIRNELRRVEAAVKAQRAKDDKRLKRAFKKARTADKPESTSAPKENLAETKEDVKEEMGDDEVKEEVKKPSTEDASEMSKNETPKKASVEAVSANDGEDVN